MLIERKYVEFKIILAQTWFAMLFSNGQKIIIQFCSSQNSAALGNRLSRHGLATALSLKQFDLLNDFDKKLLSKYC